jgi:hypothetical protein
MSISNGSNGGSSMLPWLKLDYNETTEITGKLTPRLDLRCTDIPESVIRVSVPSGLRMMNQYVSEEMISI